MRLEAVPPCHYTPVEGWWPEGEVVGGAPETAVVILFQRKAEQIRAVIQKNTVQ